MNCEEHPSPSNYQSIVSSPSEAKCNLFLVAAKYVHSAKPVEDVDMVEEGIDISGRREGLFTQRGVNIMSQTLCLKLFLPYYLSSLLFTIANF